ENGSPDESVEEGNLYRVLGNGRILNLNTYRGLQVIDVSDPNAPHVEGQLPVDGWGGSELYAVGDRALVVVDGYYDEESGNYASALLSVDVSDPQNPVLVDR